MRPIKVTVYVDPQKVPDLVCNGYSLVGDENGTRQIAIAVAKALGIEDYLGKADRIYELRRKIWEQGESIAGMPSLSDVDESIALELSAR